jgi:hypothetical protein
LHRCAAVPRRARTSRDAERFARLMCVHPDAVDDFIGYCRVEARALLTDHASIVKALADTLLEQVTLTGAQIDAVIANALVLEDLAAEKARRLRWQQCGENATARDESSVPILEQECRDSLT